MSIRSVLLFLMLIVATSLVSAYQCYQETANVSTSCGGLSTGKYDFEGNRWTQYQNTIDGDWSTFAYTPFPNVYATYYVNYTKPQHSKNTSIVKVSPVRSGVVYENYNISIPQKCWIYSNLTVNFQILVATAAVAPYGTDTTAILCQNSSGLFMNLSSYRDTFGPLYGYFAEEAMSWDMEEPQIDDCSVYTYKVANFTIYQENIPTLKTNGTISLSASISSISGTSNLSISKTNTNQISLCVNQANYTAGFDLYLQSITNPGFTHRFYLYNQNANGTEQAFSLYNFNDTTGISLVQLTVNDYYTNLPVPDVVVKLMRYYPSTGTWVNVQQFKTDDFGLALFDILEGSADYKFMFYDTSNNLLDSTNAMAFSCNTFSATGRGICQLSYRLNQAAPVTPPSNIQVTSTYSPGTGAINLTWIDPNAGTNTVQTTMSTQTYYGNVDICDVSQTGASGQVNCLVSAYSGAILTKVVANGKLIYSQYQQMNSTTLGSKISPEEGAFWSAMIILTCVGFGIMASPAIALIAMLVGLITVYAMGLFNPLTLTFLILAGVMSMAVGWRLRS